MAKDKHKPKPKLSHSERVKKPRSVSADAFFEHLDRLQRDIEMFDNQIEPLQDSREGAMDEWVKFLRKTNIAKFVSEKVSEVLRKESESGEKINKALREDVKIHNVGIDWVNNKQKTSNLIPFTINTEGKLIQNESLLVHNPDTHNYWHYNEAKNKIMLTALEKLGIEKEHAEIQLYWLAPDKKSPEVPVTCVQCELTADDIKSLIETEVQQRLKLESGKIRKAEHHLDKLGALTENISGEQVEGGAKKTILERLKQEAETRIRTEVTREILGKALDVKPFDDGKDNGLSGDAPVDPTPPSPRGRNFVPSDPVGVGRG